MLVLTVRTVRTVYLAFLVASLVAGASLAEWTPLEVRDFRLRKNQVDQTEVSVGRPGRLRVRVNVREPSSVAPVQVILVGPDGTQVKKTGSGRLRLHYQVTEESQLGTWLATVHNVGLMPLLIGKIQVDFEPLAAEPYPAPTAVPETSDGHVTSPRDFQRIRAVCRDKNPGVTVRFDLGSGTGGFFMSYNRVFELTAERQSDEVIRLSGNGDAPFYLDTAKKILYFRGDPGGSKNGIFCRVKIYYGDT